MMPFDPVIAAGIFFSSMILDVLYARYTYYVIQLKAEMAAGLSFMWHLLSAVMVVQYAGNAIYILFLCAGGCLGTYLSIWAKRRAVTAASAG